MHHLPYSPADSLEQVYHETNVAMKTESTTDDGQFASEETDTHAVEPETPVVWCADYKAGTIGIDSYGVMAYDMEQITSPGNFADGTGYDIASYDLPFPDISEQTINGISECYM